MFCIKCGHKLPVNGTFCTNCGSARGNSGGAGIRPAASPIATVQAMSASNKKLIFIAGGVILLLAIVAFTFNGIGGGELSGTWVVEAAEHHSYPPSVRFHGNRFTMTFYSSNRPGGAGVPRFFDTGRIFWFIPASMDFNRELVTESIYRLTRQGTYSVSDDRIEFLFSCGAIRTLDFRRTENTLDLDRIRFIRR